MISIMVSHHVKNYAHWKQAFDNFHDQRLDAGELSYQVFQASEPDSDLELLFTWDSEEHAKTFFHSQALASAMEEAGVDGEPAIRYLHRSDKGKIH
ncbi:MAG: hypothetical protein HRU20_27230 [Pseudomonadales bacterium]|nr:hypothetical protein [Pseudomonadales bacterium]